MTTGGYRPQTCLVCGVAGRWSVTRQGDVVVAWGCDGHLVMVLDDLRRPSRREEFLVEESHAAAATHE